MIHWLKSLRNRFSRSSSKRGLAEFSSGRTPVDPPHISFQIDSDDPIVGYFLKYPNAVEVRRLDIESPAVERLKEAGVKLVVPLVSQGEFVGLLNLGARLSQQEYSVDDRLLLNNLATQVAPALRVAQLVHQQQAEALKQQQLEHELGIARVIQQTLLPKELPALPGWEVASHYQPAKAVGGDFFDFLQLDSNRIGIVIGDVTDKGIPAAMVMAATRSTLRSIAFQQYEPGEVLSQVNNFLCNDIPQNMFVTCLYAILTPETGHLCYANAGHNLPFRWKDGVAQRLQAIGMPLGLMPDMPYEQVETVLEPGERVLLYSDGLIEAHNKEAEMFGSRRLERLLIEHSDMVSSPSTTIDRLMTELSQFTGQNWEQEDDVTLVSLLRLPGAFQQPIVFTERIAQDA